MVLPDFRAVDCINELKQQLADKTGKLKYYCRKKKSNFFLRDSVDYVLMKLEF